MKFAIPVGLFLSIAMALAWRLGTKSGLSGRIDAIWSLATGCACVAAAIAGCVNWQRALLIIAFLSVWSLRLGYYLWRRAKRDDARYAALKEQWGAAAPLRLFYFLQAQGVASWPLVTSVYLAAASPRPAPDIRDALGLLVFVVALSGEAIADAQMSAFKATSANKGGICERGLWAWSRHPNYFFEWFAWLGLPVLGIDLHYPLGWLTCIAPIEMYLLLVYVSGVPPLEKTMRLSRGRAYEEYCARVSEFWPMPPRRF